MQTGSSSRFDVPVIPLPWAGDCATLIFPSSSIADYNNSRSVLPVRAVTEWNQSVRFRRTNEEIEEWVHAVAGGDVGNASLGNVIVGELVGRNRNYMIGVGTPTKWAGDGERCDGVQKGEMVIQRPHDTNRLEVSLSKLFVEFKNSRGETTTHFKKAKCNELKFSLNKTKSKMTSQLGSIGSVAVGPSFIPAPRVHFDGK